MKTLTTRELRRCMLWLQELATCPICLTMLTPATTLCVNGHPICVSCRQNLQNCPICRDVFSNVQPTGFIQQVIQSLPHPCRFEDCTYFVKTNEDHEKFCGFKPTGCKFCQWVGPGLQILSHIRTAHSDTAVQMKGTKFKPLSFNIKEEGSIFHPMVVNGQFFWGELKNDYTDDKLTAVIHIVPNGKTESVFFVQLLFKLNTESYSGSITITFDPDVDPYKNNCIIIPSSILPKFTNSNTVNYKFFVTKKKWVPIKKIIKSIF